MSRKFKSLEDIQKYYDEETNTYAFKENNEYIDVVFFEFNLDVAADIKAHNILACNINANDIDAYNINACDINAGDINAHNINACDINACDIYANDINANDINSGNINANNINYSAVCFAYENIICKSIEGRRKNSRHFVLDGKLEIKDII